MNEKIKNLTKNPKMLIVIGLGGILLIFISSLFGRGDKPTNKEIGCDNVYTVEQYCETLEKNIKNIVRSITGDKNPTVVVTLESGIRYNYASTDDIDTSSASGGNSDQASESRKQSYITIKNADGGEQALVIAQIMPEVRGVAIICDGGNNEITAEKIKNAVTSALNITSKRVYISGGVHK